MFDISRHSIRYFHALALSGRGRTVAGAGVIYLVLKDILSGGSYPRA